MLVRQPKVWSNCGSVALRFQFVVESGTFAEKVTDPAKAAVAIKVVKPATAVARRSVRKLMGAILQSMREVGK